MSEYNLQPSYPDVSALTTNDKAISVVYGRVPVTGVLVPLQVDASGALVTTGGGGGGTPSGPAGGDLSGTYPNPTVDIATNIRGGSPSELLIQTAFNTTGFVAAGAVNQILSLNIAGNPIWTIAPAISAQFMTSFPTLNQDTTGTAAIANSLATSSSPVSVSAAVPPTIGQTLVATDATHATWQTPSAGAPAGSNGEIQFNNSGVFGASNEFSVDLSGNDPLIFLGNGVGTAGAYTYLSDHDQFTVYSNYNVNLDAQLYPIGSSWIMTMGPGGGGFHLNRAAPGTTAFNPYFTVDEAAQVGIGVGNNAPRTTLDVLVGSPNTLGDALTAAVITAGTPVNPSAGQLSIQANDDQAVDMGGVLTFVARYITGDPGGAAMAAIRGAKENGTSNDLNGYLSFHPRRQGISYDFPQSERMRLTSQGFLGINTTTPSALLDVEGASGTTLKIVDTNQGAGKVLTSDASGNASWQTPSAPIMPYGYFYALMPGDNAATVAQGTAIEFPQDGAANGIVRSSATQFTLPNTGTYEVSWQASINEACQTVLCINGVEQAHSVVGRATGTNQISNTVLITATAGDLVSIQNPAATATVLTLTPNAGAGAVSPVSASVVIKQLQ